MGDAASVTPQELSKLFVRWKPPRELRPWKTTADELDAIAAGKKSMMVMGVTSKMVASGDPRFVEILELAIARGLAVVLKGDVPRKGFYGVDIYVTRLEQIWRIEALRTLEETWRFDRNGRSREEQQSILLGYTPRQRKEWFAWWKERSIGTWRTSVYALVSNADARMIRACGSRAFPEGTQVTLFTRQSDPVRRDAIRRIPKGLQLARMSMFLDELRSRGPFTVTSTTKSAAFVNAHLRSHIELLTKRGWK